LPQEGVPKGTFVGPTTLPSKAYPGTQHTYYVHVPAQYDPAKPACLMVFNDGQAFMDPNGDLRAQNVLDNLMWRREIPVMISIFINPGRRPDQPEPSPREWGDRTANRGPEYNRIEDNYPSVICDEVLPEVMKKYNLSPRAEDHGIGGSSSGGIAAFTVAWHRPQTFGKVFTIVGSFVNLSGGQGSTYPDLILANDKKPIRIFMVDGVNDNRNADPTRDWHHQNVRMVDALTKKGYEVNYIWGIGLHGQKQGGAQLPEMMRWLWRDYPRDYQRENMEERSFRGPATRPAGE
jgi:enterochelin esterase family protein